MRDTPLRKTRLAMGFTQAEVAKAAGIGQSAYSRIETGEGVSAEVAERLVHFLGEPLTELHVLYPGRYERFMERTE